MEPVGDKADENQTLVLIAHFHVAARNPAGSQASIAAARDALRRLNMGNGLVGTRLKPLLERDYDMVLKGLVPIAYRYRHLLRDEDFDFLLDKLVPPFLRAAPDPLDGD